MRPRQTEPGRRPAGDSAAPRPVRATGPAAALAPADVVVLQRRVGNAVVQGALGHAALARQGVALDHPSIADAAALVPGDPVAQRLVGALLRIHGRPAVEGFLAVFPAPRMDRDLAVEIIGFLDAGAGAAALQWAAGVFPTEPGRFRQLMWMATADGRLLADARWAMALAGGGLERAGEYLAQLDLVGALPARWAATVVPGPHDELMELLALLAIHPVEDVKWAMGVAANRPADAGECLVILEDLGPEAARWAGAVFPASMPSLRRLAGFLSARGLADVRWAMGLAGDVLDAAETVLGYLGRWKPRGEKAWGAARHELETQGVAKLVDAEAAVRVLER